MASSLARRTCSRSSLFSLSLSAIIPRYPSRLKPGRRLLQTSSSKPSAPPKFAFAFDIDGVLLRSSKPLPGASRTLRYLQAHRIPFILLTNGGGKTEAQRVSDLSKHLEVPLEEKMFVQSHTPFAQMVTGSRGGPSLKNECVMVLGGEGNSCRRVAEDYGFKNVITPGDLITACPSLWPFANRQLYTDHARPLPSSIFVRSMSDTSNLSEHLRVAAILVFHDPRDWALDAQIVVDLLLSQQGYLGTLSRKNGNPQLENCGYQQDGQPTLWFSNADLFWASEYHLDRLGQGAFLRSLIGLWDGITGGFRNGVELKFNSVGKPSLPTFLFAEQKLKTHRAALLGVEELSEPELEDVYMIGDNPASDIVGANSFDGTGPTKWHSILVKTGVYKSGKPAHAPKVTVPDVEAAVEWALKKSGWQKPFP